MPQESDSLKSDISDSAPQSDEAMGKLAPVKPRFNDRFKALKVHPVIGPVIRVSHRILRRLYDFSGELFAASCGLVIAWLYAVSWLLTQQSVDVSRFKPDAERWFSQAFEGNNAEIDMLSLRWLPASDSVVVEIQDINVRGEDGADIQNFAAIKTGFPLRSVIAARPVPSTVEIRGGTLSWVEDENGLFTAGLGTPETVGRLGPVYRGVSPQISQDGSGSNSSASASTSAYARGSFKQVLTDFKSLNVEDTTLYYLSKKKEMDVVLDLNNLDVLQSGSQIDFSLNGGVRQTGGAVPLDVSLTTDSNFARFEGRAAALAIRLDELAPRKGRFRAFSRLQAPLDIDVQSVFSQADGLQASQIKLDVGSGAVTGFTQPQMFKSAQFIAALEPGEQRMKIETIALNSPKFTFTGEGEISELGALSDGDINSSPVFNVRLKDVAIDAVPTFTEPLAIEAIKASGQVDFDARRLSLPKLSVEMDGYGFDLAVDAIQNAQTGKLDSLITSGNLTGVMGPRELLAIWPPAAADGARRWVDSSVKDARIEGLRFKANLDAAYFENPVFAEEYITGSLDISGGLVKYMRAMPPIKDAVVRGRLIGNRIEADVLSGTVGGLTIEKGRVEMPRLLPIGGDILINMTGTGTTSDMLTLIDNEPFEYATKYGVDPKKVGGEGRVEMSITRPMLVHFDQSRIEYAVKGDFTNATAPFEIMGQKITEGQVRFESDKTGLLMSGPVKIGPWAANMEWREVFGPNPPPTAYTIKGLVDRDVLDQFGIGLREYFDGTIPLEIKASGRGLDIQSGTLSADLTQSELSVSNIWSKAAGEKASLVASLGRGDNASIVLPQVNLQAPGLEFQGNLEIGQNLQLRVLDFSKMRLDGLINAAVQLKPDTDNQRFSLFVEGEYLDVSPWVSAGFSSRDSSSIDVPVLMTATLERLTLAEGYTLSDAKFLLTHSGTALSDLRLGGTTEDGPLTAEIVNESDGARVVTVQVPDASKAVTAFLGLSDTQGGVLNIKAKLPPIDTDGPTVGNAEITDFKLKDAPFLAQILSLASLTGLVDTLGGGGLAFERFEVPFTLFDNLLQVRGARLYGPAIGMTGDGDIQLETRLLDFDGTVVPAYSANTIFNDIPVLKELVGRKGEGVFALNYTVKGPFEKVQINVNPLSALTPGFLRGIFRPKREKLPDEIMEQIEAVRPKEAE